MTEEGLSKAVNHGGGWCDGHVCAGVMLAWVCSARMEGGRLGSPLSSR